ncbi:hypothetical protein [Actinoplanes aureus]|uniref:hypothetical protein n=1 Tax=Actinoplanes aureus TaxID=2792083 RepID=UPI0018C283F4|nr:hypothetical protein [Actinoplanes aureus]
MLVLVGAMVFAAPAAAYAEPYPVSPPDSGVSDGTVEPGGTVTFSGEGFLPFERISIEIGYEGSDNSAASFERAPRSDGFVLAAAALPQRVTITTTADENGRFSVQVPLTEVGNATLVATGLTSGVTVTTVVEVVSEGGSGGGDDDSGDEGAESDEAALPTTGPSGEPLLIIVSSGVGAVLLGTALMWLFRIRRRTDG